MCAKVDHAGPGGDESAAARTKRACDEARLTVIPAKAKLVGLRGWQTAGLNPLRVNGGLHDAGLATGAAGGRCRVQPGVPGVPGGQVDWRLEDWRLEDSCVPPYTVHRTTVASQSLKTG